VSFDARTLFELLPAVHRVRDAELARSLGLERGPLEVLIGVLAEQIQVAGEGLEQAYDDLFIETCADWVVPYIGDLVGYRPLHGEVAQVASPRAEVAHTIALRRRKGTALVLEQLARDVTGWDARAVEYFQRLVATQYMNHPRPHCRQSPDLRDGAALASIGTPFEQAARTVDVRRIETGRGRHNIANVGLHLWRIRAYAHSATPATRVAARLYRASPLGHDLALYNRPLAEDQITHLAEPDNVPSPLSRHRLAEQLDRYYGTRPAAAADVDNPRPALLLSIDGATVERDQVLVCDLSGDDPAWAHAPPPAGRYAIDPVLGRIALPGDAPDPADVRLSWREGFSADIGGGEYARSASLPAPAATRVRIRVPDEQPSLNAALAALSGDGIIEIGDNARYAETLDIQVADEGSIEIRAVDGRRPHLDLSGFTLRGGVNAGCILNGLLVSGAALTVPEADNGLERLDLVHCTLVPGLGLQPDGLPALPGAPSLRLGPAGLETRLDRCIVGAIRSHARARISARDSVIDATASDAIAYAASADDTAPGAALALEACTTIGRLHMAEAEISNSILLATLPAVADPAWPVAVRAAHRQVGCIRFSWLPFDAIVPTRYRCQPGSAEDAEHIAPRFNSLRYATPAYVQLSTATADGIRRGAEDESEMGALHHLYGPQRESNLRIRLAEYLRVGLNAGIFYAS
jgi:hypothetical protein